MNKGLVELVGKYAFDDTVDRVTNILKAKEITLFAIVDHSGEAAKVGMTMPPTKLLIFGSPKAGTPLMLASTSIAIDLPLKILIRQDQEGRVWISYNSPQYLKDRHDIPESLLANIVGIEVIAAKAAE